MGVEQHHAIVVYHYDGEMLQRAHDLARTIFPSITNVVYSDTNGWRWFLIPPDGSKDGWERSNIGDERRARFLAACEAECVLISWGDKGNTITTEKNNGRTS